MLLTCSEMRALEERVFADGIAAEALMEDAGAQIAAAVRQFFPAAGVCYVVFGKGHNGGDALVAARHLAREGWRILNLPAMPMDHWAPLTRKKFLESGTRDMHLDCPPPLPGARPLIVLDGLLGIGATGGLRGAIAQRAGEIKALRRDHAAHVFAIDIPTGLDGDTGTADPAAVVADTTLTIGFAKTGLLADGAIDHVGRLAVLPLAALSRCAGSGAKATVATPATLAGLLPPRRFDTHKGQCGRVGIVAGSRGLTGAAALCAGGALRGGAGLVTLHATLDIQPLLAARCAPEIMVRPTGSYDELIDSPYDILAVGPGIGLGRSEEILTLIEKAPVPMILDADALNILAQNPAILDRCAGPRLLTPHPGEMARLRGSDSGTRAEIAEEISRRWPHTLLFKGARTLVAGRGRAPSYNTTGHPGLASGGMGDVLTGLLAALAAQGLPLYDAARAGAWLLGRAAEIAVFERGESAESLHATSVLENFGPAFSALRSGGW